MTNRPNVFVIQTDATRDLSSANDYGVVRHILPAGFQPSLEPERAMKIMRHELEKFRPGDYITSTGADLGGVFIAGLILPEFHDEKINWLRWERKRDSNGKRITGSGFYVPAVFDPLETP